MPITMPTISPTSTPLLSFIVMAFEGYDEDAREVDEVDRDDDGAAGFVEVVKGDDVLGSHLTGDVDVGALERI